MRILHIGVGASSEKNADLFFQDLLGLEKAVPYSLAAELGRGIFAINRELSVIHYKAESIDYEVFIDPMYQAPQPSVLHSCLEVDDQAGFLERCGAAGFKVNRNPKGDSFVTFISDFDGNLFEVKEKK
jgi:catechol 2,3-dioxygenase-like lactoylglutathione lyase family enzyme